MSGIFKYPTLDKLMSCCAVSSSSGRVKEVEDRHQPLQWDSEVTLNGIYFRLQL